MNKIILTTLSTIFLVFSDSVSAEKLIGTKGETLDCSQISINQCYREIECGGYSAVLDSLCNGSGGKWRPKKIDSPVWKAAPVETITCATGQTEYNGKCFSNNDYCREKYGSFVQWYDDKKDCDCKPGYEWKVNAGGAICVQIPPKPVEVPKVEAPVPVVPVAITPVAVEKPKAEPIIVKESPKPTDSVLEVKDSIIEDATSSENVQDAPQIEAVSEPAPVEPVITPEPKKEPNFFVRLFEMIFGWFKW